MATEGEAVHSGPKAVVKAPAESQVISAEQAHGSLEEIELDSLSASREQKQNAVSSRNNSLAEEKKELSSKFEQKIPISPIKLEESKALVATSISKQPRFFAGRAVSSSFSRDAKGDPEKTIEELVNEINRKLINHPWTVKRGGGVPMPIHRDSKIIMRFGHPRVNNKKVPAGVVYASDKLIEYGNMGNAFVAERVQVLCEIINRLKQKRHSFIRAPDTDEQYKYLIGLLQKVIEAEIEREVTRRMESLTGSQSQALR